MIQVSEISVDNKSAIQTLKPLCSQKKCSYRQSNYLQLGILDRGLRMNDTKSSMS